MQENLWKAGVAAAGAAVVSYLGALAAPLLVLLCVMLIDYVTGLVKAYMASQLSSASGCGAFSKSCATWRWSPSARRSTTC